MCEATGSVVTLLCSGIQLYLSLIHILRPMAMTSVSIVPKGSTTIFLLMVPGTALNVVCYALGGVVLACAAVQLVRYFVVERGVFQSQLTLISGLICLALGAFLIIRSDIVVRVLPIVFGLFIIFDSLGRVQNALEPVSYTHLVAKQIGEHRNGAENAHREIPPFG